jgi:hypothetical protein
MRPADNDHPLIFKPDRRGKPRSEAPPRRRHERLYGPCVAIVRGVDTNGHEFSESTVLENVSAGGLYVTLQHRVALGARLFVVFAFSSVALNDVPAPKVAAHGEVRRVASQEDARETQKACGVGIEFRHYRFL